MSLRMLCMGCSKQIEGPVEDHACGGDEGWDNTALRLIWRVALAQGGAMWN